MQAGSAPERHDAAIISLFFVFWMFVGSFFALNLFVGVIIDNFNRIKAENDGSATMTEGQAQWAETMKTMSHQRASRIAKPPSNKLRLVCFKLINSVPFDVFLTGVIIANVGAMACDYWGIEDNPGHITPYNNCMTVFSYIYYIEFVFKFSGLGPKQYFSDAWCQFDFFLVTTSLLDQFAAELLAQVLPLPPMLLRVLRVFRVLRILRLLKGAKGVRDLIMTMVLSLPSLVNVCSLLALLMFMFSVLGVQLFTYVKWQNNVTETSNFVTFGNAFLLLFQCLTGDGWAGMMDDCMITPERGCDPNAVPSDCGGAHAVAFFVGYQIIGSFVFLNLVVAVILENFSSLGNLNPDLVSAADIEIFKEVRPYTTHYSRLTSHVSPLTTHDSRLTTHDSLLSLPTPGFAPPATDQVWADFDPDADQKIPGSDLPDLVSRIPPPMGVAGQDKRKALRFCMTLNLQQEPNGDVGFQDVMDALVNTTTSNNSNN